MFDATKIDHRWESLGYSLESINAQADGLILRPNAPEPLKRYLEIMKSLYKSCAYDYELTLVLYLFLGVVFESAMRLKYQISGHTEKEASETRLKRLIDWGLNNNYFEEDAFTMHASRELRNAWVHSKEPQIAGIAGIGLVRKTVDVINGIYDDKLTQRRERKQTLNEINDKLSTHIESGFILHHQGLKLIIFDARFLLYNNLVNTPEYYLGFYPIFEIPEHSNFIDEKAPIFIKCHKIKYSEGKAFEMECDDDIYLRPLEGENNIEKFDRWKEKFRKSSFPLPHITGWKFNMERQRLLSELIYKP